MCDMKEVWHCVHKLGPFEVTFHCVHKQNGVVLKRVQGNAQEKQVDWKTADSASVNVSPQHPP